MKINKDYVRERSERGYITRGASNCPTGWTVVNI